MRLRPLLAALALAAPIVAAAPTPVSATVSSACNVTWYYNSNGAYKMFTRCNPGILHYAQRARINCNNGARFGIWQTQPGPYYGSTATCPSGGHAVGTSYVEFY